MRDVQSFNDGWLFEGDTPVRLPHTAVELPHSYFDEKAYQRAFTYEKTFDADPAWAGKEVIVQFDGAMADSKVYLNGELIVAHPDGYTPFSAHLTGKLNDGANTLTVTIDGSENPAIPPFGYAIDYLTYAGIYRDVWLKVLPAVSIGLHKIETPDVLADSKTVTVRAAIDGPVSGGTLTATLIDSTGTEIASAEAPAAAIVDLTIDGLTGIDLWSVENPALYQLRLDLSGDTADSVTTTFGFRSAEWKPEGFFLNGERVQIRGLNRHQSFPYSGYAMGKSAQEADARMLKNDLKLNLVRTSHYPQSKYFLDECDRIGLLVFEEIPGWQHIGDEAWQDASVENTRAMIERDWNHPSIIIWGVRINESLDSHDFYKRTNDLSRKLDPTRATGGVRYITDSELLEDVYTMNDFILGEEELGDNRKRTPLRPQQEVTGLPHKVPYIITEYNGHMFPTKSTDQEQRQAEHVTRHLDVLNAAYGDPDISGSIGWCTFDYNTHKDFGSGDRICHHGVMDMFREPKFAAYAYTSQCDPEDEVILKPVTFWARGERNIGSILPLIVLTNCDEVELHYGDTEPLRLKPAYDRYPHLPHPPVIFERSHFPGAAMGVWGMTWDDGKVVGYRNGEVVAEAKFVADPLPTTLQVAPDAPEVEQHQEVRVMVRMLDQAGNKLPFMAEPVTVTVEGAGELIGPSVQPLRNGSTGFWVRATDIGAITINVHHDRIDAVTVNLTAV